MTSRLATAKPAVRPALKARTMLSGPTGAGKTRTALIVASVLAPGGKVVMLDTEKESGLTYADDFQFEHVGWGPPYDPRELASTITEAGRTYDVVIVDSTSHFWRKAGGTLDIADGKFGGWKTARPAQEDLVDAILGCGAHVILCTRSKMAHVQEEENGRQVVKKLGMAPQQDDDLEYELNVACELDMEHRLTVSKSRCIATPVGKFYAPGHAGDFAQAYKEWLEVGEPAAAQAVVDDLVGRMNALDELRRKAVKGEFVARFGRPEHLRESQVDDATELVASFEAGPASPTEPGDGTPAPTEEEAAPQGDAAAGVNGAGSTEGAPPAPSEPDLLVGSPPATRFHEAVKAAMPYVTCTDSELRHLVVSRVTGGKTEDWRALIGDALDAAVEVLTQVAEGTLVVRQSSVTESGWILDARAPADGPFVPDRLGGLRDLIGQVKGLGEARTFLRAKRLADDNGLPCPSSFDELDGELLELVTAEVRAEAEGQAAA